MSNILIINGHQYYDTAQGKLSKTLFNKTIECLSTKHQIQATIIQNGYQKKEEQEKFLWADSVIYQFPIYWFEIPALMKEYAQDIFEGGVFFKNSKNGYGTGGMLNTKTYMFSSSWNTPLDSFGHDFWEGTETPDDVLIAFHKTQKYLGMKKLPSFSCHDVIKKPDVEAYLKALERHLNLIFNN